MLKPHDRIFIRLDKTPECDERTDTDRHNRSGYYSGLHCQQCGRAVKTHSCTLLMSIDRRITEPLKVAAIMILLL